MPTAIVHVYTSEGIVIASDGRVVGDRNVITDEAQKLFFVPGKSFVYATMGTSLLTTGSRSDVIFVDEALEVRARAIRIGPGMPHTLEACGRSICAEAFRLIEKAKEEAILDDPFEEEFTTVGYPGFVFGHVFLWGYRFGGRSLRDRDNPSFAAYRIPAMAKNHGITMDEGIEIARNYIAACQTPEARALDPKPARALVAAPRF